MSRAAPDTATDDDEGSAPRHATRQRIFQRNKRRYAIRLEEGFWTQLEDCAREDGRKLSDFLFEAMDRAGEGENRTAQLRLYCLEWLRQRLARVRQSAGGADIQTVLSACPSPCVIMTKEKAIVAYNSAFAQSILKRLSAGGESGGKPAPLTFRLDTPLEDIHADLLQRKQRYRETKAAFVQDERSIKALARFCLLEPARGPNASLLCFLRSDEQDAGAASA